MVLLSSKYFEGSMPGAIESSNKGSGTEETAGQSTLVITPSSNLNVGAFVALCIAYDSGDTDLYSSISDTKGNTWTSRQNDSFFSGDASDVCCRVFTTSQDGGALTTSDSITVVFSSNVQYRVWTLTELWSRGGSSYGTGATLTAFGINTTITTGTISNGDAVLGVLSGHRGNLTFTPDSDIVRGSWSTAQTAISPANGVSIITQAKVVTADGTQTYNPGTSESINWVMIWISVV